MAGLGKHEARLAALDAEAVGEQGGIPFPAVRRVGVDLGVQRLQFVRVRSGLFSVEQLQRQVGHGTSKSRGRR